MLLDTVDVGALFIDLVGGDDDFDAGFTGKTDGFDCLRLDAVIGGDDDNYDVGQQGAVLADGREGLVARRIQES